MDTIVPHHSKRDMLTFNTVRLWLGVTFLSEICTVDGTAIAKDAWAGTRPQHTYHLQMKKASPHGDVY